MKIITNMIPLSYATFTLINYLRPTLYVVTASNSEVPLDSAKYHGGVVDISASYSGGPTLKSQPKHQLFQVRFLVAFSVPLCDC